MTLLGLDIGDWFVAYGLFLATLIVGLVWYVEVGRRREDSERVLTDAMVRENARRLAHDSGRFIDEYERETWTPYDGLTVVGELCEFERAAQRREQRRGPAGGMSA